eukprot:GHVS01027193.1.p1 GENE.GHVS01027193.1~~GHVS01027193.1.p1  ORF type:complete len:304 (+),score=36.11 GHVS01027193.1:1150-2061(+)
MVLQGEEYTRVSQDYKNALAVFHRHVVYDIRGGCLTNISDSFISPPIVDIVVPEEKLVGIFRENFDEVATGKVHPVTSVRRDQPITEMDTMVIESFQRSMSRKIKSAQAIEQSRKVAEANKQMSKQIKGENATRDENSFSKKRNAKAPPEEERSAVRRASEVTPKLPVPFWTPSRGEDSAKSPEKFVDPKRSRDDHLSHGSCKQESFLGAFECPDSKEDDMEAEDDKTLITREIMSGPPATNDAFHFTLDELAFNRQSLKPEPPMDSGDAFRFSKSFTKKKKTAGWISKPQIALPSSAFRAAS